MTAEFASAPPSTLEEPRARISSALIERVVARSVGAIGVLFAAQSTPSLIAQLPATKEYWLAAFLVPIAGALLAAVVASIIDRGVKAANAVVAVVFLAALIFWPLEVNDPGIPVGADPWLYYLCTVATSSAAIAFRWPIAAVYTVVIPVAFVFMRVTPSGGSAPLSVASLEGTYVTILGGAILVLVTMVRQAAAALDAAQAAAIVRYTDAVRQHATDVERVEVDAIVHDSILATLLSAARAYRPDTQALASSMAQLAIKNLKDAETGYQGEDAALSLATLVRRVSDASAMVPVKFDLRVQGVDNRLLPFPAVEAVYAATMQAMANSAQHAAAPGVRVRREVLIRAEGTDGFSVEITDDGAGFDQSAVSKERLGLRVSIGERVTNIGGQVEVISAVGKGTTVRISWAPSVTTPDDSFGFVDVNLDVLPDLLPELRSTELTPEPSGAAVGRSVDR